MKWTITHTELQLLQERFILLNVQAVEHIIPLFFGQMQNVVHHVFKVNRFGHIIIRVSDMEGRVLRMLQDTTRERVEAHEVCDHSVFFNHETLHDVVSWYEEVSHFFSCELNMKGEILQILVEELVYLLDILIHHSS